MLVIDAGDDERERRQRALYRALLANELPPRLYAILWMTWAFQADTWRWN